MLVQRQRQECLSHTWNTRSNESVVISEQWLIKEQWELIDRSRHARARHTDAIKPAETPARRCSRLSQGFGTPAPRIASPFVDVGYYLSHPLLGFTPRLLWLIIYRASPPSSVTTDFMNRILLPQHPSDKRSAFIADAVTVRAFLCGFRVLQCLLWTICFLNPSYSEEDLFPINLKKNYDGFIFIFICI